MLNIYVEALRGINTEDVGNIVMRQGDVRRFGRFLQDGNIVVPYDGGRVFKWLRRRVKKGKAVESEYKIPTELVLMSGDGLRQVSFKDIV